MVLYRPNMLSAHLTRHNETPSRHVCHCGKSFLRKEHLKRHQATHARPSFACPVCHRCFTRNDVLRRHISVHSSTQLPAAPRGRRACNACHENKTKCNGGSQCSLCAKRRILCVYSRDPDPARDRDDESTADGSLSSSAASIAAGILGPQHQHVPGLLPGPMSVSVDVGRAVDGPVPTAPTAPAIVAAEAPATPQAARLNLEYVLAAVRADIAGRPIDRDHQSSDSYRLWFKACLESYLGHFQDRWGVLHASSVDDHPQVDGTIALIASWIRGHDHVQDLVFALHDTITSHALFALATSTKKPSFEETWPYHTYLVALLNVVFAFESGRVRLLVRARRLLNLMLDSMREKGAFNRIAVEKHEDIHSPGDFRPWCHFHRERWSFLVAYALKIDVYLGLFSNQPPFLDPDELEHRALCTFAFWNTWGLDRYYAREPDEPRDRENCNMAEMARNPHTLIPSGTLIEDAMIGLCGVYPALWRSAQVRRPGRQALQVEPGHVKSVSRHLETWKMRLENTSSLWADPVSNATAIQRLLLAYRGRENADARDWEHRVLNRITISILNTRMLYYLLKLHLHADVRSLTALGLGQRSIACNSPAPPESVNLTEIRYWGASDEARRAAVHSITVLLAYENAFDTMESPHEAVDPVARVALCTAAIIVRGWFLSGAVPCICTVAGGPPARELDMESVQDRDQWVAAGGPVSVGGIPLCRCSLDAWMARFTASLKRGGGRWEMGDSVSALLMTSCDDDLFP